MANVKTEMRLMERKISRMEVEIMRLKVAILPKEKLSKKERRELAAIKKDMAKGHWISARELFKNTG